MYSSCYIQELRALYLDALLSNAVNIVNYAAVQLAVTRDVPIYIHLLFCKKKTSWLFNHRVVTLVADSGFRGCLLWYWRL